LEAWWLRNLTERPKRLRVVASLGTVTVDFLIPPSRDTDQGGRLRDIEKDFAAIISPGLKLAFQDRRRVRISGKIIFGENASREARVCGPGAFVVLKAFAFKGRGENKDAYDLYYLARNFMVKATLSGGVYQLGSLECVADLQKFVNMGSGQTYYCRIVLK